MKKLLLSIFFVVLAAPTTFAFNQWDIPNLDVDINIQESGKINVTETIVADFSKDPLEHRGIFRQIPVSYRDDFGNKFNLRFELLSITDENGNAHPLADQSKEGDMIYLKIGDPYVYLDQKTTYVINYEIDRAVGYFNDHDELYWNIFEEWDVPIISSTVTVTLPSSSVMEEMKATCYTGYYGSVDSVCTAKVVDDKILKFTGGQEFYPGEGFTIVAGFSKGTIVQPSLLQRLGWFIADNWILIIPILAFAFLYLRWWYAGRDPEAANDTIIPRFKPPEGLTPTEVGTIVDEKVDVRDISAVVIDYAIKGYLKIKEIKTKKLVFLDDIDYEIEIIKDYKSAPGIQSHETEILNSMFGSEKSIKLSKLKYKYYEHLKKIKKKIYKNLTKGGFFVRNPESVRGTYFGIGVALITITVFAMGGMVIYFGILFVASVIATGLLFIIFSKFMPKKTIKGAKAYNEIKGLEEYLRTAEKDRIKFQSENNIFFEKLLAYAMVLGLADKWAEAFKDIYKGKNPNWFESSDMSKFDTYYLVSRLNNFSTHANTAFASSPRSSGGGSSAWSGGSGFSGGFSGGGFGGGGGGGW